VSDPSPRISLLRRARRLLGKGRRAITGGARRRPAAPTPKPRAYPFAQPRLPRRQLDEDWPTPPEAEGEPFSWWVAPRSAPKVRFDIELFERLNEEYASKPLVPKPRDYDVSSRTSDARTRLARVASFMDLERTTTLEIGCGPGEEVWLLRHKFGCRAYGIDVQPWPRWPVYRGDGVHLLIADASAVPFEDSSFDRIVSFTVWEHIEHPFRALSEAYRILRPGGEMWLNANLHRGPSASHQYRDINFPWPHLLFDESIAREFFRRRGREEGFYWVNRLTYDTYRRYFDLLGFEVVHLGFTERELDQDFYERFEAVLGRYPISDLTRDFFTTILRKPDGPGV